MRFNSIVFLLFLAAVLLLLWLLPQRFRKAWLTVTSAFFYGTWHWPYLLLLIGTVGFTHVGARWIDGAGDDVLRHRRKRWVIAALCTLLGLFKYADWLIASTNLALGVVDLSGLPLLELVLPLGISFYVFETIGYIYDLGRKREPLYGFWDLLLWVAFFPHLIAGPIMRAKEFIKQTDVDLSLRAADVREGVRLIATGLFLKVALADGLSQNLDQAFARDADTLGATDVLVMGAGFGLQVYLDFSAYSRIGIGAGRLCGIRLVENFDFPFSAKSPTEFWNRWHMSLSHWIRDYLFYPLVGGNLSVRSMVRASIISMALCGLWHGAGAHYVAFGVYHGLLLAANYVWLARKRERNKGKAPKPKKDGLAGMAVALLVTLGMFALLVPGWIFFRTVEMGDGFVMLGNALTPWAHSGRTLPGTLYLHVVLLQLAVWLAPVAARQVARAEDVARRQGAVAKYAFQATTGLGVGFLLVAFAIYLEGQSSFIYFQF